MPAESAIIEWSARAYPFCGAGKVIWLEGNPDEPITSGRVDGYVMACPEATILIEDSGQDQSEADWLWRDIAALESEANANGRALKIIRVKPPRATYCRYRGKYWTPCCLNAYVANGAVVTA